MTDKIVVLCSCASEDEASKIARQLVEQKLAACVAIVPDVQSIYRWKGEIERSAEWSLTIKTRRDLLPKVTSEIRRLHSYDVPEILALPIVDGSREYMEWMEREIQPLAE